MWIVLHFENYENLVNEIVSKLQKKLDGEYLHEILKKKSNKHVHKLGHCSLKNRSHGHTSIRIVIQCVAN